jgi:GNAT superfamily N-acetyltransferase
LFYTIQKKYILTEQPRLPIVIKKIDKEKIDKFQIFSEWRPSWENSFTAMKRIPVDIDFYSAEYSINKLGLIVYYPCLNWIMALLVNPEYRNMGIRSALLNHLVKQLEGKVEMIKLLNIQSDDENLITFLKQSGFELLTGQFEMKYKL